MQKPFHFFLLLFFTAIIYSLFLSTGAHSGVNFSSANISTKWINNPFTRYILYRYTSDSDPVFGCGFGSVDSAGSCESFLFSIFIGFVGNYYVDPQIVWSANRDRPVRENATLEFSKNGDLLLLDFDGTLVWSTDTSGKSVVRMEANLVLFDKKNNTVWSSMDYPTDSLVLGQTLRQGQRLTANVSVTNSKQGPFYLSVVSNGIQASVGSQSYYYHTRSNIGVQQKPTSVSFNNGSLGISAGANSYNIISLPLANSLQYMQLDSHFTQIDKWYPNKGCMPSTAISCKSYKTQQFLSLPNVSYFGLRYTMKHQNTDYIMRNSTQETCKLACLANCSCKAAFFQYDTNASNGYCYLPSELYSLKINVPGDFGPFMTMRMQSFSSTNSTFSTVNTNVSKGKKVTTGITVAAAVGALLAGFLVALCVIALVMRRFSYRDDADDDEFSMLPGLPTRFAFEDLRVATNDFLQKLGEGGFGFVFEGTLVDGTKIAVKKLEGLGQGKKEFLAELETIGSIHHIHLVRLVGFCAEKFYRLLVYEYMPNGSLDKWIFYKDNDTVLD